MFSVYILYSTSFQKSYVGQTSDLENRISERNSAENNGYTNRFKPWVIIHIDTFPTRREALKREKYLRQELEEKGSKKL